MLRLQWMHGFLSLISAAFVQSGYRMSAQELESPVSPERDAVGGDGKGRRRHLFGHDGARRLREAVERSAGGVVRQPARAVKEDAVDAGRKLRSAVGVEAESEEAADEAARDRL